MTFHGPRAMDPNRAGGRIPAQPEVQRAPDPALVERDRRLAAWLQAAAGGDGGAFEAFHDATFAVARGVARRLLRGGDEADDLLADVYFEAWRRAPQFDPARGSAMTWLLVMLHTRAIDRLRRHEPAPPPAGDAAADDPADRLWPRELGPRLDAALRTLDAPERWVVGLAFWRGLSHAAIAAETGLPLGTVKTHLRRACARLRDALEP